MRAEEEEVVNAYSHLISAILSAVFCIIFVIRITESLQQLQLFLLGAFSFWTFFASFLYHNSKSPKKRSRNLVLDRVGIYMMILASGLSFSLSLIDYHGKLMFSIVILIVGFLLITDYCSKKREDELYSIVSCLLFSILCTMPLTGIISDNSLVLPETIIMLTLSMIFYSAGVIFYTIDSKKWAHTAWHVLVSLGYASCFTAHLNAAHAF